MVEVEGYCCGVVLGVVACAGLGLSNVGCLRYGDGVGIIYMPLLTHGTVTGVSGSLVSHCMG